MEMGVVGVVFIAFNHFLAVAPFLSTADGPLLYIND
jgi:energy-converting hydrogenase Eha subunit E